MKRVLIMLLCLLMLLSLAACSGDEGKATEDSAAPSTEITNSDVIDNNITDTNDMTAIETSFGTLYYPAKWAGDVSFTVNDDRVDAACSDVKLFTLYFGGEEGDVLGAVKKGDSSVELRYVLYDIDADDDRLDELSAMQDDINVIIQYMIQSGILEEKI